MSGTGGRFYDENEAEEILRLASRDSVSGKVDKERLLSMAAELGITPEAVERAEAEMVKKRAQEEEQRTDTEDRAEYRQQRRRELWGNLGSYISTNMLMVGIWAFSGQGYFWPFWVIFPWGAGVIPSLFGRRGERDYQRWKRKKYQKLEGPRPQVEGLRPVLEELAASGETEKLLVIKELRLRTGVDLRTAKDAVEEYAATHDDVVW